jgi:hypothetical protein
MSLKINNRATPKQIQMLKDMDYDGKWDLSTDEAAEIITALFEQRRQELKELDGGFENFDYDNNKWKV